MSSHAIQCSSSNKSLTLQSFSNSSSTSNNNSFKVDREQDRLVEETPQLYYCEGCEKEFTQKIAYDAHCANHETCRHPGCTFSGTKKVVIAHFHGSHGLYSGEGYKMIEVEGSKKKYRVLLGVSPEEIEKWRMDRRKNFPTAENTLKKKEQRDELRKAGGLVLDIGKKRKREPVVHSKKENIKAEGTDGGEASHQGDSTGGVDDAFVEGAGEGEGEGDTEDKEKDNKLRKRPCVFFVKGSCKQGDQCTYSHDFEIKVCNFFVRSGRCTRGNRCTFAHDKDERAKFLEERKSGGGKKQKEKEKGEANNDDATEGAVGGEREGEEGMRERKSQKVRKERERDKKNAKEELNDDDLRARTMKKKGHLFLPKPFSGGSRGTLLRNLLLHEVEEEENILLQCLRLIVSNNYLQPVL
jgi:Nuclear fragile X mental retardation-interacting protein 1 (NUFIP1)/Zinc finger domain/Zinc finger C-x8-C-x5-C-x3-H type (and similar)